MEEEYWINSYFSVARYYGGMILDGKRFLIVNKEGKPCVITPGQPADLIDERYLPIYRKIGRDRFIEILKQHRYEVLTPEKFKQYASKQ